MTPGYLSVHTHDAHRGRVRLVITAEQPDAATRAHDASRVRYTARFNDSEAATMHTHEVLKRRLLDPDARLYRASCEEAIAAVESIDLRHRTVYRDPQLDSDALATIDRLVERNRRRRERRDRFFQTLGFIGIGILLINLFVLSLA